MKWFKHKSDSHQSSRLRLACEDNFLQGYGFYFCIVEMVAMRVEDVENPTVTFQTSYIKSMLGGINQRTLSKLLKNFEQSGLLVSKDLGKSIEITVPKLKEIQDNYSRAVRRNNASTDNNVRTRLDKNRLDKNRTDKSVADKEADRIRLMKNNDE
tara:strand:+ start:1194 stop:1658 length:465 start_codon:yes stop_codon:yes gene_type:complete